MGQQGSHMRQGGNLKQVEGGQGVRKNLTLLEERKSAINPVKHRVDAVKKFNE